MFPILLLCIVEILLAFKSWMEVSLVSIGGTFIILEVDIEELERYI